MLQPGEKFKAAAFDLDGTLIDTMPDLAAAVNLMLSTLGAKELPDARVRALVGNGVDQLVLRALTESLADLPTRAAQRSAANALFRRLYSQRLFNHSRVYPGVERTLQALTDAGVNLCCITNKDSMFAVPLLEAAGLQPFFSFTLCADREEDRKPKPDMLLAACSRLGITPAELLYVGDSKIDIAAARAAGCQVVAVTYGYDKDIAAAQTRADGIIDTITELIAVLRRSEHSDSEGTLHTAGAAS
jgi:phosphoglycolate phosphatase